MSQVQGIIPGMRKEEEVPDPVPQEEYQEYQVGWVIFSQGLELTRDIMSIYIYGLFKF